MPFQHGKAAKLYVNGWNLSPFLTKVGVSGKADMAEVSALGTTDKQFLNGMVQGSLTADGFNSENFVGAGDATSVLGSAYTSDVDDIYTHITQSDVFGGRCNGMVADITDWSIDTDTGGAGALSISADSNQGFQQGLILHPLGAEVAGGNSASWTDDLPAGITTSPYGVDGYLQVFQAATANLVVKIQDSPDHTAWTDLVIFVTVSAGRQGQMVNSLATRPTQVVQRYLRCLWTITGSATFFCSVSRLIRPH